MFSTSYAMVSFTAWYTGETVFVQISAMRLQGIPGSDGTYVHMSLTFKVYNAARPPEVRRRTRRRRKYQRTRTGSSSQLKHSSSADSSPAFVRMCTAACTFLKTDNITAGTSTGGVQDPTGLDGGGDEECLSSLNMKMDGIGDPPRTTVPTNLRERTGCGQTRTADTPWQAHGSRRQPMGKLGAIPGAYT